MKTEQEIDNLMAQIPINWRDRWCGGEDGPCACLGCVQIGNRRIMAEAMISPPYLGDPEYIDEGRIAPKIYESLKITREEWENWRKRHNQ